MRLLLLTSIACGSGGLGSSDGTVTYTDAESGTVYDVPFVGGALAWDYQQLRWVAVTDWGRRFDCEYAQVHLVRLSGRDLDRDRDHHELLWNDGFPDSATVLQTLFEPDPVTVVQPPLEAQMQFDDEARTMGTLTTESGTVTFEAYDCGAL